MPRYARLIQFTPGDETRLAVRDAHRAHLRELFDAGTLVMSGPWTADDGALLIYDAPNLDAARDLVAADPYTQAGVITELSLHEWNVVFGG